MQKRKGKNMKKMRKVCALVVTLALTASLTACGTTSPSSTTPGGNGTPTAGTDEIIIMRIGHGSAAGSARDLACEKMAEVIERESNGRIDCQVYPASSLGSVMELIQGVQTNTIECTVQPISQTSGFQPLCTIVDIPYCLPTNYEDLTAILDGPVGEALDSALAEVGISNLSYWFSGFKDFTANSPLDTPDSFNGLKFRSMSSTILMAQYKAVNATPVYIDFSETYNALSTGAVDGQDNPPDTITDMNFQEVQKYAVLSNHGNLQLGCMVSKAWFDNLSEDLQSAVLKGAEEGRKVCYEETCAKIDAGLQKMKDADMVIKELSAEELGEWVAAFAPVKDVYLESTGDAGQKLMALVDEEIAKLG